MAETSNKLQTADKEAKDAGTKQHTSTVISGKHVIWGIGALVLMVAATFGLQSIPQSRSSSRSANSSFTLSIPPGGKSEMFTIPEGKKVTMTGGPHRLVNVYRDGRECSSGCSAGAIKAYVRNLDSSAWNNISCWIID